MKYNDDNFDFDAPEFVIALVGAVGSELQEVDRILSERLKKPV